MFEEELISIVQKTILRLEQDQNWTLVFAAADLLMALDPIHEMGLKKGLHALQKLNLTAQASRFYTRFADQYQHLLGETYAVSFAELTQT